MPDWKHEIRRRLAELKLDPAREAEIVEELAQHLEDRYAELRSSGATQESAHLSVLAELNESELLARLRRVERLVKIDADVLGANRRNNMVEDLRQDLRYGIRMLRNNSGFTLIAVLTLALGIGVNTAIFTMFNLWFRPLPVKDPATVVNLGWLERGQSERSNFPYPDYVYFREHAQVFSGLIASTWDWALVLGSQNATEETRKVFGQFVSDNFFSALGVNTVLGRSFTPDESSTPGQHPVVILSYDFWQGRFGGDSNILGRTLRLNGQTFVVVGVTERGFGGLTFGPHALDIWLPLTMTTQLFPQDEDWFTTRASKWVRVSGRLNPGRTLEDARAEMTVLFSQLARAYPEMDPNDRVRVLPGSMFGEVEWASMGIILTATTMVLLIACANIVNLLLARAVARRKEIGIRLASRIPISWVLAAQRRCVRSGARPAGWPGPWR
ncbi:MAG: ABC transporter permease [Acidobacteriota bacterium]